MNARTVFEQSEDHERRLRRLEFWFAFVAGGIVIGSGSSILAALKLFKIIP